MLSALPIAGGSVACGAAAMAWAVRGRASAVFGPSVWRGARGRRAVALTFDDGPSEETPRILEILAAHGAASTFFPCGANVERLPATARAVAEAGHEIGNHGYNHPLCCFRSGRFIEADMARAQQVILEHTGVRPVWYRAPYGVRWFGMRRAQQRLGLKGVMWTVIGYDWNLVAGAVVARMAGRVSNGAILCLHDGRELRTRPDIGTTIEAVRRLVPLLLERGYKLETVSQLLCPTT
ncbi:MAG: polysaccharide deacetylase family protein [Bryobacteraceae bacterium]